MIEDISTQAAELDAKTGLEEFVLEVEPVTLSELNAADTTKCCASGTCD